MSEALIINIEPEQEDDHKQFLKLASWICGICFVVSFSVSVATQVFTNYFNQSTKGFSSDYALTHFIGFFFLLLN